VSKKTPPPAQQVQGISEQEFDNTDLLSFFTRYRFLLIGSLIALVAVVIFGISIVSHYKGKDETGWNELSQSAKLDWSPYLPLPFPFLRVETESLEKSLNSEDSIKGTSAEPWALFFLSLEKFKDGDVDAAQKHFEVLTKNYSDHYVCQNEFLGKTLQQKLKAERAWRRSHTFKSETEAEKEKLEEAKAEDTAEPEGTGADKSPDGEPSDEPSADPEK